MGRNSDFVNIPGAWAPPGSTPVAEPSRSPLPRGAFRHLERVLAAVLATCALGAGPPAPAPLEEYAAKAQALVELPSYFRRPGARPAGRNFTIVVVGRSPFGPRLDAYAQGSTYHGGKIEVRYVDRASEIPPCDVLFICRSERRAAAEILEAVRNRGVLTVADDEELLKRGVMVDILAEGGYLKIYLNKDAATAESFEIRSQLLALAKIVGNR